MAKRVGCTHREVRLRTMRYRTTRRVLIGVSGIKGGIREKVGSKSSFQSRTVSILNFGLSSCRHGAGISAKGSACKRG